MNPNNRNNNLNPRPPRRGGPNNQTSNGQNGRNNGQGGQNNNQNGQRLQGGSSLSTSRGQAVRAQKRSQMDAQRIANQYSAAPRPQSDNQQRSRANFIDDQPRLRVIGLGGMDGGGSKNMMLIEYINDAVV